MDSKMLMKIDVDFHEKEVHYHDKCTRGYLNKARAGSLHATKNPYSQAERPFESLLFFIQSSAIDNDKPEFFCHFSSSTVH